MSNCSPFQMAFEQVFMTKTENYHVIRNLLSFYNSKTILWDEGLKMAAMSELAY